ncbi:hypothetical protein [Neobacillus niacini]|uniref:hypothetical protein n=1 Tax=Neobacillus niacini TaxID=86668 RepID=UPI003983020D
MATLAIFVTMRTVPLPPKQSRKRAGDVVSINVNLAASQANKINNYSSKLLEVKNSLNRVKGNLNNGWNAQEMIYINQTIDSINREVAALSSRLDSIGTDILSGAQQIQRQEEAEERRKAEAETKAKAEAEKKAKAMGN